VPVTKLNISDLVSIDIHVPREDVSYLLEVFRDYHGDFSHRADIIIEELDMSSQDALQGKFKLPLWNVSSDHVVFKDRFGKACWVKMSAPPFHVRLQRGFDNGDFIYNVLEPLFVFLCHTNLGFDHIPFHGSVFTTRHGKTVLVVGDSGFGKTSLLLHQVLTENGVYVSDELAFLHPSGTVRPYTRQIYLYRRNFSDFPALYDKLQSQTLRAKHVAVSALFSILDHIPGNRLTRKIRSNFFLDMCPVRVHPGLLGNVAPGPEIRVTDIVFLARAEDADKTAPTLLRESFVVLWFERYLFYLGAQLNDMFLGGKSLQEWFGAYSHGISRLLSGVEFHKVIAEEAGNLDTLNRMIERAVLQND